MTVGFIPHTELERNDMLAALNLGQVEDLFQDIPSSLRFPELKLPIASNELDITHHLQKLASENTVAASGSSFLGAGIYQHFRPAIVDDILRNSEFYSSYTPYQPEASQGMLQAMFEYQSMICQLTQMDVSNASHYNGATALAEAVRLSLAVSSGKRHKILLSPTLHPQYRAVVETYLRGSDTIIIDDDTPFIPIADVKNLLDQDTAALVVQNPNFFGQFEHLEGLAEAVHNAGALLIVVPDLIALGLFQPPGHYSADVVAAEGQCLGNPLSFGGPHLGVMATRKEYLRQTAGRLVGATVDEDGQRGYVLTLSTREQHIRREKATSNICTNSTLTTLAASVYLATMGKSGLKQVAELCYQKSHYAAEQINSINGIKVNPQAPKQPFFKEFVVELPCLVAQANDFLLQEHNLIGGYDLGRDYPALEKHTLLAVTELNSKNDIDRLVAGLQQLVSL